MLSYGRMRDLVFFFKPGVEHVGERPDVFLPAFFSLHLCCGLCVSGR